MPEWTSTLAVRVLKHDWGVYDGAAGPEGPGLVNTRRWLLWQRVLIRSGRWTVR